MKPHFFKILVLEDHAFQRAFVVAALRQLGCVDILEAADGAQALAVLKEYGPVDIAICDIQMEGMDGVEFLYQIAGTALVNSIVISSTLALDLRRSVQKIVPLLGMRLLGDIGKPFDKDGMATLFRQYMSVQYDVHHKKDQASRLETAKEVRRAFQENEFVPYFQPKFNLKTGAVEGVEVLARWLHPERGLIYPSAFIPVLERCDLMDAFFFEQLEKSILVQREALNRGCFVHLSLNMHSGLLADGELHSRIDACVNEYNLPCSGLTFELTESSALNINPATCGNLLRIRMLGCNLSIDDFGCGYSSLQRLCELPFNEIKIDAGFVHGLSKDARCRAIIRSTVALGASLNMSVVAEGIETTEQRIQLLDLGCTVGQGYIFARPMSESDFLQWLRDRF